MSLSSSLWTLFNSLFYVSWFPPVCECFSHPFLPRISVGLLVSSSSSSYHLSTNTLSLSSPCNHYYQLSIFIFSLPGLLVSSTSSSATTDVLKEPPREQPSLLASRSIGKYQMRSNISFFNTHGSISVIIYGIIFQYRYTVYISLLTCTMYALLCIIFQYPIS